MSRRYPGGLITKTPVVPTISAAPGIWTLDQAITYIKAGTWPGIYWIGLLSSSGDNGDTGYSVAVDSSGNVYVLGASETTPGAGTHFQLAKYDTNGNIQWQRRFGNVATRETGYAVAVNSAGDVYVCGTSSINPDPNLVFQTAKYDTSGALQWQRGLSYVTTGPNIARSVAVDSFGDVYVCGYSVSAERAFQIVKYNPSGSIQWQRRLGGTTNDEQGEGVAVDSSGNVYVCGHSESSGTENIQIAKYDTNGVIQWQRSLGSATSNLGYSVAVDSSGNVYVCGVSGSVGDSFFEIAKYDTNGTIQWKRSLGDPPQGGYGLSIAVDSANNVYVCGFSRVSGEDFQIAKYNTAGTIQWQRSLSSTRAGIAYSIAVDSSNNFYVCGYTTVANSNDFLFAKLPADGSLTGTYTVGGYSFTYAASTLTDAVSTLTSSTSTLTDAVSTLTDSATTLPSVTSTLTSSVTRVP